MIVGCMSTKHDAMWTTLFVNRFAGVCRVCMLWKSSSMGTIKHANCEERKVVQK